MNKALFFSILVFILIGATFALSDFLNGGSMDFRLLDEKRDERKAEVQQSGVLEETLITIKDSHLKTEIVRTSEEQARGLSGRESLAENAGMLFVYEQPAIPGFWMPDMRFSIDIIWIDENRRIIDIAENVAPETYPEIFRSPFPILYVLEVNAGWTRAQRIVIGDTIDFLF